MGATPYNEMYLKEGAGRAHYLRYAQWLTQQPASAWSFEVEARPFAEKW